MTLMIDLISFMRLVALYMSVFGFLFSRAIEGGLNLWWLWILSGICAFILMKAAKIENWKRVLPLVLCVLFVIPFKGIAAVVAVLPIIILLGRNAVTRSWHTTYDMTLTSVKIGIPMYLLMFVFLLPNDSSLGLQDIPTKSLPFFLIFLGLSIFGLRILRHENLETLDRKYVLLNFGIIAGILLVCALLSSTFMMNILIQLLKLLYQYVIMPVLALMLGVVIIIPYGIYMIISWILSKFTFKSTTAEEEQTTFSAVNREVYKAAEEMVGGDMLAMIFRGIAIAAFLILAIIMIRKLGGRQQEQMYSGTMIYREDLKKDDAPHKSIFTRTAPDHVIRRCYQQFLKLTGKKNIPVDGSVASDVIADLSESVIHSEEPGELRRLWLPVRYGGEVSEAEAQKAKDLLKTIRHKYREEKV